MMIDNKQIYDKEAEEVVLGSIIGNSYAWEDCRDILSDDCFYFDRNKEIFKTLKSMEDNGESINMLSLKAKLDGIGVKYDIVEFAKMTSAYAPDIIPFALRLDELRKRRVLWNLGNKLISSSIMETCDVDDTIESTSKVLADIGITSQTQFRQLGEIVIELREQVKRNMAGEAARNGTPTGFKEYDKMGGGFQPGDFIIIAGETSQGKSSLATCVANNAAKAGCPVAIYSLEMTSQQLAARLVAIESGVSSSDIIYKELDITRFEAFDRGAVKLIDLPIYIDETATSNLSNILGSIRSMTKKFGVKGAIIDYLQILSVNNRGGDNAEQLMGNAARELKNIAKELGIWVIALSQLSRDREKPEPSLARLRQSGQIAEAADVVMLIYRPEVYDKSYGGEFKDSSTSGTALIDIAKGRNIGLKKFLVGFDAQTTKFYEIDNPPNSNIVTNEPIPF